MPAWPQRVHRGRSMNRISASIPDNLAAELNAKAVQLGRSRADLVRQAIERYLDDLDDEEVAVARLGDSNDPELKWEQVSRKLLDTD